jgi:hypothetical protein
MNMQLVWISVAFPVLVAFFWVMHKLGDIGTRESVGDWFRDHWLGLAIVITFILFLLSWILPPF